MSHNVHFGESQKWQRRLVTVDLVVLPTFGWQLHIAMMQNQ